MTDTLWQFPCDDPACGDQPRAHRPYASARGKNHRKSVSDFAGLVSGGGDGLVFHGARLATLACQWKRDDLAAMDLEDAVGTVRRIVAAMQQTDMDLGTHAHSAAEAFSYGIPWREPDDLYPDDRDRLWNFVSGIGRWWETRAPKVVACEFIVANDDPPFVGTGDNIMLLDDPEFGPNTPTYVDWKSHRRHKADESKSFGKWSVQCNLIGNATRVRHYHGNQLIAEIPWEESGLPRPKRAIIVSLGPHGEVREYECPIDPASLRTARSMLDVLEYKPDMKQRAGVPVTVPKYAPRPDAPVNVEAMLG